MVIVVDGNYSYQKAAIITINQYQSDLAWVGCAPASAPRFSSRTFADTAARERRRTSDSARLGGRKVGLRATAPGGEGG